MPNSLDENKAVVRRFFEESDRRNALADELLAPGFTAHTPGSPPMDLDAFKKMMATYDASFSDYGNTVNDMVAEGDKVAFCFGRRATHTGEFMGVPASGKQVSWMTIGIARLVDGKIAEFWNSPDRMGMMQHLGIIPY